MASISLSISLMANFILLTELLVLVPHIPGVLLTVLLVFPMGIFWFFQIVHLSLFMEQIVFCYNPSVYIHTCQ